MDTDKLKALALAARDERVWPFNELAFQKAANPATVLALIADRDKMEQERDELRAEVERLKTERDTFRHGHSLASNRCCELEAEVERLREGMEIAVRGLQNIAAVEARAAPAAGTETDAERLDFMITEECQIEHMDRVGSASVYRVYWPWRRVRQHEWSATPREAIDAAIAASKEKA